MIPTTKSKQRAYLDGMIGLIAAGRLSKTEILLGLRTLRRQMRNRPPVKRASPVAQKVTPVVRGAVLSLHRRYPDMTNQNIANRLNLNGGRVSEILAGKRR